GLAPIGDMPGADTVLPQHLTLRALRGRLVFSEDLGLERGGEGPTLRFRGHLRARTLLVAHAPSLRARCLGGQHGHTVSYPFPAQWLNQKMITTHTRLPRRAYRGQPLAPANDLRADRPPRHPLSSSSLTA